MMNYNVAKINTNTSTILDTKEFTNAMDAMFYIKAMNSLNEDANIRYEFV